MPLSCYVPSQIIPKSRIVHLADKQILKRHILSFVSKNPPPLPPPPAGRVSIPGPWTKMAGSHVRHARRQQRTTQTTQSLTALVTGLNSSFTESITCTVTLPEHELNVWNVTNVVRQLRQPCGNDDRVVPRSCWFEPRFRHPLPHPPCHPLPRPPLFRYHLSRLPPPLLLCHHLPRPPLLRYHLPRLPPHLLLCHHLPRPRRQHLETSPRHFTMATGRQWLIHNTVQSCWVNKQLHARRHIYVPVR